VVGLAQAAFLLFARAAAQQRRVGDDDAAPVAGGGLVLVPCTAAKEPVNESALACARRLEAPAPVKAERGEFEGEDFWEEHEDLLRRAWAEAPRRHPGLFRFDAAFEERYLGGALRSAAAAARVGDGEKALHKLFSEVAAGSPGVWASDELFTEAFTKDMQEELAYIRELGVPLRRPNGMNRYGAILDDVGFESMFTLLIRKYLRPLAEMLFPEVVGPGDAEEHYAFSVRYMDGEDVELARHSDASVVTMNLCLGGNFSGGDLRFFGNGNTLGWELVRWASVVSADGTHDTDERARTGKHEREEGQQMDDVVHRGGRAIFHRGQHKHQALRLESGERTNVIVWLFGEHGDVRVAPYPPHERLTAVERWRREWDDDDVDGIQRCPG